MRSSPTEAWLSRSSQCLAIALRAVARWAHSRAQPPYIIAGSAPDRKRCDERRHVAILAFVLFAVFPLPVLADEASGNFLLRLFDQVCVPNIGRPEKIRAWAAARHLETVSAPAALAIFVGDGTKGAAWAVPSSIGSFALSIRGTTQACAVWASRADTKEVEAGFIRLMEGVRRPGLDVNIESDTTSATASGQARALLYTVWPTSPTSQPWGFTFMLVTAERPGGPFQASIQGAVASRP
jgi:hypothetical protein